MFGIAVPTACPDVPATFLDPRSTWADRDAYDRQAARLAAMFAANFAAYADGVGPEIAASGPIVSPATPLPTVEADPSTG